MPALIHLQTIRDSRGSLTVMEKGIPFPIKRVFYTYGVPAGTVRGGHGHQVTRLALVAAAGACSVSGVTAGGGAWEFRLDDPSRCLVLEPADWHQMRFDSPGTILLCMASEDFSASEYFYERPEPVE